MSGAGSVFPFRAPTGVVKRFVTSGMSTCLHEGNISKGTGEGRHFLLWFFLGKSFACALGG
jgi:hypothetical protein